MDDHHHNPGAAGMHDDTEWDGRYASAEQLWSGQPNAALVVEVAALEPGRALDVGCGEGADAIWLASQGWQVTGLDVSEVALQRAEAAAGKAGVHVEWIRAGLLNAPLAPAGFDLVTAAYPALLRTPTGEAERALLAAVAAGGHLLVVHHADIDVEAAKARGFDPADFVSPRDVSGLLGEGWHFTIDERRPRHLESGAGAGHTHDVVLHAQRLT
jgi:SAM-dependent methyltransferase